VIQRVSSDELAATIIGSVLLDVDVLPKLYDEWQTFSGLHRLANAIGDGVVLAWALRDEDGWIGMLWGYFDPEDGTGEVHVACKHGVDSRAFSTEVEGQFVEQFNPKRMEGNIDKDNRAALLYARRMGYKPGEPSDYGDRFVRMVKDY